MAKEIGKVEMQPIATVDKDGDMVIPENDQQREGMITDLSMIQLGPMQLHPKCVCHAVQMPADFDITLTRQRVVGPRGAWLVRAPGPAAYHFVVPDGAWQRMASSFNPAVEGG